MLTLFGALPVPFLNEGAGLLDPAQGFRRHAGKPFAHILRLRSPFKLAREAVDLARAVEHDVIAAVAGGEDIALFFQPVGKLAPVTPDGDPHDRMNRHGYAYGVRF